MTLSAITGYPRIGPRRELKRAVEGYWDGRVDRDALDETGRALRLEGWQRMREAGIDLIPSNTFSHYDHVLDAIAMVGAVPPRYGDSGEGEVDAETYFAMARGAQREGLDVTAMEMIKWFDTNYHYIVPELGAHTRFRLASRKPLAEYIEPREAGIETVPVLLGPLSLLLLGKGVGSDGHQDPGFDRLSLLPALLDVYEQVIALLRDAGAQWIQLDEPVLVQDRSPGDLAALAMAYDRLATAAGGTKLLVQTYFGGRGRVVRRAGRAARRRDRPRPRARTGATSGCCNATGCPAASTSSRAWWTGATSGSTTSAPRSPRCARSARPSATTA